MAEAATTSRKPKRRGRGGLIAVVGIIALVVLGAILYFSNNKQAGISIEVQPAAKRTIDQTVLATGIVDPETQVKISSEVSGEIVYLGVQEGDHVQKGQVLVKINPQQIIAEVDEARAGISSAQARAAQAKANLLHAQQDLSRMQQLFDKKLATQQELDNASAAVKVNEADLDAARFAIEQSQASFRRVQQSVVKTTIVSPISGVVTKLNSKLGEKVVGAIQMTGTEIMTIADLSVIEAVVDVSETDVVQVHFGDTADVEVDAIPGQKFKAYVSQIANSPKESGVGTQEQMTNFEVHLRFIDPDLRFRPGMTATATIRTDRKENVLSVPIQSVTTRTKKQDETETEENGVTNKKNERPKEDHPAPIVFIKVGDSVVTRTVKTGIRDDQYIEITDGLKPGDVVVSGSYKAISTDLENGSKVTISKPSSKKSSDTKGS